MGVYGLRASFPGRKDKAFHAPRTNLGVFLAGQPRAVHEGWGAVFTRQSRLRGVGLEHRFIFLWADELEQLEEDDEPVSFEPALLFLRKIWVPCLEITSFGRFLIGILPNKFLP